MISKLLQTPAVFLPLSRLSLRILPRIFRIGKTVIVTRWQDVAEVLSRDDDFRIEPINKKRIDAVSGSFFLGMDRKPEYFVQRHHGYNAMAAQDWATLPTLIEQNIDCSLKLVGGSCDVIGDVIRPVAIQTAVHIFGIKPDNTDKFATSVQAVFHETFLNLGNDPKVRSKGEAGGKLLTDWTIGEIEKRRKAKKTGTDFLGQLMSQMPVASAQDITNISNGYLVGSIDTTVTTTAHVLYEIISNRKFKASVMADINHDRRFLGWIMEALRRRPHNPVILRQAAHETSLAGKTIKQDSRIFAVTLSAMQDSSVFLNPKLMDPARQLNRYMHFGYGPHVCAGRDLNVMQIPILVKAILKRNPVSVASIISKGPFPDKMTITFGGK